MFTGPSVTPSGEAVLAGGCAEAADVMVLTTQAPNWLTTAEKVNITSRPNFAARKSHKHAKCSCQHYDGLDSGPLSWDFCISASNCSNSLAEAAWQTV